MIPSTKEKQRAFLDGLIANVDGMTRVAIKRELRVLRRELRNRKPVKMGTPVAQKVTPAVRAQVLRIYRRHPTITNQVIADRLNLNAGRVSEILAGKRR